MNYRASTLAGMILFFITTSLSASVATLPSDWQFVRHDYVSTLLSASRGYPVSVGVRYRINRDGEVECGKRAGARNCSFHFSTASPQLISQITQDAIACRHVGQRGYYHPPFTCHAALLQLGTLDSQWTYDEQTRITFKFNYRTRLIECASYDRRSCYVGTKASFITGLANQSFRPKICDDFSSASTVCSSISTRYGFNWVINAPEIINTTVVGNFLASNPDIISQTIGDTNARIINGEFHSELTLPDNVAIAKQDISSQQLFSGLNTSAHIINYAAADFSNFSSLETDATTYASSLSIAPAPDSSNLCTAQAADQGRKSGLASSDITPISGILEMLGHTPADFINACNMRYVAAVDEGVSVNWIIASAEGSSQQPTHLWRNDWIVVPDLSYNSATLTSNRYAGAYIAFVASYIKSQLPHYAPPEIKQLIFNTATDLGAEGIDSVYGVGRVNFSAVVERVTSIRYSLGLD